MYIISACLLGENCRYNGGNNYCSWVAEFAKEHKICSVCPEVAAGLPIPRPPAEIVGERIKNSHGDDWTDIFAAGAKDCYRTAEKEAEIIGETIEGAILKARSPSCGCGQVYDGSFNGKLVPGDGCFTQLLKQNGITVITEKEKVEDDKL